MPWLFVSEIDTDSLWIESQWEYTKTPTTRTTSSQTKNQCTYSRAYGTPTSGQQEAVLRKPTGKRRHSFHHTKISLLMGVNGKTLTLNVFQPPPKTGGTNMKHGILQKIKSWILLGSKGTWLYMTIAKIPRGLIQCLKNALWALGIRCMVQVFWVL